MKRSLFAFALLVLSLTAPRAPAIELTGRAHIDYQTDSVTSDTAASYRLQVNPGAVYVNHFSILDYANMPVWTVDEFSVDFTGLSNGLRIRQIGNGLWFDNFPGFETTINPDSGFGYHEFGPAVIELPAGTASTPEPSSLLLALGGLLGLALRPWRS